MFEVDWTDCDLERVGQRRARKYVGRDPKKEDAGSTQDTISTRTSRSSQTSGKQHSGFLGDIGRNKDASSISMRSQVSQELASPKSTKNDENLNRASLCTLRAVMSFPAKLPDRVSMTSEGKSSTMHSHISRKTTIDMSDHSGPGSPDRSSKESMLSKTTQLTIPGRYSHGEDSVTGGTRTTTALVQALNEDGTFFAAITAKRAYGRSRRSSSVSPQIGSGIWISASPKSPLTQELTPLPQPTESSYDNGPASEAIDEWFTALHGPNPTLPKPDPVGALRQGNVLLPPNLYQPAPLRLNRQTTSRETVLPSRIRAIRFLADNPDDWKTPADWDLAEYTNKPTPSAPTKKGKEKDREEEPMESIDAKLESFHSHEWAIRKTTSFQQNHQRKQETPRIPAKSTLRTMRRTRSAIENGVPHVRALSPRVGTMSPTTGPI